MNGSKESSSHQPAGGWPEPFFEEISPWGIDLDSVLNLLPEASNTGSFFAGRNDESEEIRKKRVPLQRWPSDATQRTPQKITGEETHHPWVMTHPSNPSLENRCQLTHAHPCDALAQLLMLGLRRTLAVPTTTEEALDRICGTES